VDAVLDGCKAEGLAALAQTSCNFIDDLSRVTVTRQPPLPADRSGGGDDTTSVAPEQASAGASDGVAGPADGSGCVEDKVCIPGAACLKVHFDYE